MISELFAVFLLYVVTQAECQQPSIVFSRSGQGLNTVTFACRTSGGLPISNTVFRRYEEVLNSQSAENYDYQLSPDNEGNFTCEQGLGGVRSEVLQLAAKPTPPTITNKVKYVQLGSVAEFPCDYQPGILSHLYSIEWVLVYPSLIVFTPENLLGVHRMISQTNFSLFADIEYLSQNQDSYQCTVFVESCSGACRVPQLFNESGADITLRVVEPPEITGVRRLYVTEGEMAEFTCSVTDENITSIYWTVDNMEYRDCNQDTKFCVNVENGTSVLAVNTTNPTQKLPIFIPIVCIVIQEFEDENIIINPDTQALVDTIQFKYSKETTLIVWGEGTGSVDITLPDYILFIVLIFSTVTGLILLLTMFILLCVYKITSCEMKATTNPNPLNDQRVVMRDLQCTHDGLQEEALRCDKEEFEDNKDLRHSLDNPQEPVGYPISSPASTREPVGYPISSPASTREPVGYPISSPASPREPVGYPISSPASTREPVGCPISSLASTQEPVGYPISSPASTREPVVYPISSPASPREPNRDCVSEPSMEETLSKPLPGAAGEDQQEPELDMEDLSEVSEYLLVLDHDSMYTVGKALGLNYLTLKKMRDIRSPTFPDDVIAAWLRKQDQVKSATWKSLISALRSVGQNGIADKIEQKKHSRLPSTLGELWSHPQLKPFVLQNPKPGRVLGTGVYGSVVEVQFDSAVCAGKKFRHDDIFNNEKKFCKRFTREYACISKLQHKHIVQYRGVCSLPDSALPVLVMERLETNLHDYLLYPDNANLALTAKVSILRGTAKGLVYLHNQTPAIIHRDLTARNVLLNSKLMPKISDFGNSQIFDVDPSSVLETMSNVPGTLLYMPPEAFHDIARYNTKLDIFGYGQLALFTTTQVFPNSLLPVTYYSTGPGSGGRKQLLGRTEVERRKKYFDMLKGQHFDVLGDRHRALMKLIETCLDNEPKERPKATAIETKLDDLRRTLQTVTEV